MSAVSTSLKIDPVVKQQAKILFDSLGMNLSTAINIFLYQAVKEQAIPFRIGNSFYSEANMEYLQRVTHDIDTGKSVLQEHELLEV